MPGTQDVQPSIQSSGFKFYFQCSGLPLGTKIFTSMKGSYSILCWLGTRKLVKLQGVPKKMHLLSSFEFLTLGEVFLGVKNNSKNFGNKKNIGLFSKRGIAKSTFICEGAPKMAPSGRNEPKFCM